MPSRLGDIRLGDWNLGSGGVAEATPGEVTEANSLNFWDDLFEGGLIEGSEEISEDLNNLADESSVYLDITEARISQIPRIVWILPDTVEARIAQISRTIWLSQGSQVFFDTLSLSDEFAYEAPVELSGLGDSLTLSDALLYWYLIWDFIIEPTASDNLDFWKDGFALDLFPGQIDISVEDMDYPDRDFLEIDLSQWLLALSVEGYDTLQYELWDTLEILTVTGKSFFDSLSFADTLNLRLDWTFGKDDSLDLSDLYGNVNDESIVPNGDLMSLSDSLIVNSLIDSAFDLSDSFELSDSLEVPTLSRSITSYLRRYLNDVVRS